MAEGNHPGLNYRGLVGPGCAKMEGNHKRKEATVMDRVLRVLEWSDAHNPHPFAWAAVTVAAVAVLAGSVLLAGLVR